MATTSPTPLSPRACAALAQTFLEVDPAVDSLWTITSTGPMTGSVGGTIPGSITLSDVDAPSTEVARSPFDARCIARFDLVDDLLGTTCHDVSAVALVVESRIDGADGWTCLVQSVCGCAAVAFRSPDGTVRLADTGGGMDGYLHDLCRRILGLQTLPEPSPPASSFVACWLATVLDVAADPRTCHLARTWPDLIELHPLVDALRWQYSDLDNAPPEVFAAIAALVTSGLDWELLRRGVAAGDHDCGGLSPAEASWMDAGMFARWTRGCHRDVGELLDDCSLFLEPTLFDRLQCAIEDCLV